MYNKLINTKHNGEENKLNRVIEMYGHTSR